MNIFNLATTPSCALRAWCGAWCLLAALAAQAADAAPPMRDPMQPPPAAQAPLRAGNADAAPALLEIAPRHLMTIEGRRYLIDGGRRLAVGAMLGSARIERIDDGSVWLREAGALRQVSLFGGIVKRAAPSAPGASSPTLASPKPTAPRSARAGKGDLIPASNSTLPTGKRT